MERAPFQMCMPGRSPGEREKAMSMSKEVRTFFIQKDAKEKAAFRLRTAADIPAFLAKTVRKRSDGKFALDCLEGEETAPAGVIIAYEREARTKSGWNSWVIADESRIIEKDGKIYSRPQVTEAALISDRLPSFMDGADVVRNSDGSYTVTTDWGKSTGKPGEGLFVRYGTKADGTPDVNILTFGTKSAAEYNLCTEDGRNIFRLSPEAIKDLLAGKDEQKA